MTRPRWKRWVLLAVLVALLVQCAIAARPYDQTYAVFAESNGIIDDGERFGVTVGSSVEAARFALQRRGWREDSRDVVDAVDAAGWRCRGRERQADEQLLMFTDPSWRTGTICLYISGERVRTMAWMFNPLTV